MVRCCRTTRGERRRAVSGGSEGQPSDSLLASFLDVFWLIVLGVASQNAAIKYRQSQGHSRDCRLRSAASTAAAVNSRQML